MLFGYSAWKYCRQVKDPSLPVVLASSIYCAYNKNIWFETVNKLSVTPALEMSMILAVLSYR